MPGECREKGLAGLCSERPSLVSLRFVECLRPLEGREEIGRIPPEPLGVDPHDHMSLPLPLSLPLVVSATGVPVPCSKAPFACFSSRNHIFLFLALAPLLSTTAHSFPPCFSSSLTSWHPMHWTRIRQRVLLLSKSCAQRYSPFSSRCMPVFVVLVPHLLLESFVIQYKP
jgi:hypothetical protein